MLRSLLFVFSGLLFLCASQLQQGTHYCETCGRVCVNFCNTRDFRPCCINFIRKRSAPVSSAALAASLKDQFSKSVPEIAMNLEDNTEALPWQQRRNKNQQTSLFKNQQVQPSLYYLYNAPPASANSILESDV